jgi:hypothetical protein
MCANYTFNFPVRAIVRRNSHYFEAVTGCTGMRAVRLFLSSVGWHNLCIREKAKEKPIIWMRQNEFRGFRAGS